MDIFLNTLRSLGAEIKSAGACDRAQHPSARLRQELSSDLRTLYEDDGGIRSRSRLPMRMSLCPQPKLPTCYWPSAENFPDLLDEVPAYSGPTTKATMVVSF